MVMQDAPSVFETDLFAPIIEVIKSKAQNPESKSIRIIADHIKASVFIIADGVEPSNLGRGYVLRRLIRRAIRHGKLLGIEDFTKEIAKVVTDIYKDSYPEVEKNKGKIFEELNKEEERFRKTLEKGLKEFENGTDPFILFTTYGFPVELTQELAKEKGIEIDIKKFNERLKTHQELSRTASAGMFKGGLAEANDQTIKYHTATHLLLAALRKILGDHVAQKGSNITAERLRFDFSHSQKMTELEKEKTENLINEIIQKNIPVVCQGEEIKIYTIGDFSKEKCGGPHVKSTGELGRFKIIKEEASAAGIRRIKAILL